MANKKKCSKCSKERVVNNFYASNSPFFSDKKVPICKNCLHSMVDEDNLLDSIVSILRQVDKPFIRKVWNSSVKSKNSTFGDYMKTINSLHQYKGMTFNESDPVEDAEVENGNIENVTSLETEHGTIEVDKELKAKWGAGYTNLEYIKLEQFYEDMMNSYDISTPPHKKILMQLAKLNIKLDKLLEDDDFTNYQKISKAYDDMLKSAGFRPIDRKTGDESTGMRSFSQVWAEVEDRGFVPPWDVEASQDMVDKTIQYMSNFTLKLFDKEVNTEPPKDTPKVNEEDSGESDAEL